MVILSNFLSEVFNCGCNYGEKNFLTQWLSPPSSLIAAAGLSEDHVEMGGGESGVTLHLMKY